ncbi:MAG: acyl-CoA thioesterase [Novosphingobium sp.]
MAKPDPALLDPARYPFRSEIETRFGDLDLNQHINNVALAQLCEESRVRFHKASGYHAALATGGVGAMVASLTIEFLGQGYYPEPVTAHVAAERLGNSSYSLVKLIRQGDRTVVFARATMVVMKDNAPVPIPQVFRESVQPWMFRS